MHKKTNIIVILLTFLLFSCTATRVSSKVKTPPTKSFVKILHTTTIFSCKDKKDPTCPLGTHGQIGSGMAINLLKKHMTVITAGHVCDSQPSDKIENSTQLIYAIDHTDTKHQAWPLHVSFHNSVGTSDLCILWVPTLNVKKIDVSRREPKIGEELYYIGAPLGIHHPPTVPIFKGIYSGPVDAGSGMVTFPAIGGSSGSAVLDKDFKIVGVVFAANRAFHHVSIITSYKSFKVFLSEFIKKHKKRTSNTQ